MREKTFHLKGCIYRSVLLGGLLLLAAGRTVSVNAAEAEISWKIVTQEINEENQYVYDGNKTDFTMNGILQKKSDGRWGYVDRGIVRNTGSVLAVNWNGWWHVVNGWVDNGTGLYDTTSGTYKFSDGKCEFTAHQTVEHRNNMGWYLTDGKVETGYTGLAENKDGIYWITNGKTDTGKNGLVKDTIGVTADNGMIYLINGKFDPEADTVAKMDDAWWKVRNGVVDKKYNGLAKNDNGWWYLENGKVRFDYNGVTQNENGLWYVKDGKTDFKYTGWAYGYYFVNSKA